MKQEQGRPARLVLMGAGSFAVPALAALAQGQSGSGGDFEVVGVVTQPDRHAGRGRSLRRGVVASLAGDLGLTLLQPESLRQEAEFGRLAALRPDVLIVASYGRLLSRRVLDLPARGCLNLHPSRLPRHRGPSPVAGAILAGDTLAGVTVMEMAINMDAGPIVAQRETPLLNDDTTESLTARLSELNALLLMEVLPDWLAGRAVSVPQDEAGATYTTLFTKEMGRIDWPKSAIELSREVRAFMPWPVSHTRLGEPLRIWRATVAEGEDGLPPGTVLSIDSSGIRVQAGRGSLLLTEVQPAGRRRMPAADYGRGRTDLITLRAV